MKAKKIINIEVGENLIVSPSQPPRHDWDKAFALMHYHNDDQLLDTDVIASEFDDNEWTTILKITGLIS